MRIFLTGATGYIGAAVLDALTRAGHQVTALVRNAEKGDQVAKRGATPVIGSLERPELYWKEAAGQDGYIHTALQPTPRGPELDRLTVETLIDLGRGRNLFFIYTSGIWVLGNTHEPAAESAPLNPAALVAWRPVHERLVLDTAKDGMRGIVVRPGIVYGGSRGIIGEMFKDAMNGLIRVVGSGDNHWPCVYDRDLGDLYARLAGQPDASGVYHANDEADERVNDIVAAIRAHVPGSPEVRHVPLPEARAKMKAYADALALDQKVRSPRGRALGWSPTLHSISNNATRLFEEWRSSAQA